MPHQTGLTNRARHRARHSLFPKGMGIDHFSGEGAAYVLIRIVLSRDARILVCVVPMVCRTRLSMRHSSNRLSCRQGNDGPLNRIGEKNETCGNQGKTSRQDKC